METHKIYNMPFSKVYLLYIQKALRRDRTKQEVDTIICWLTGFTPAMLEELIDQQVDFQTFFKKAKLHPNAQKITGVVGGIRVERIEQPLLQQIRYLDKLIDELAKKGYGKDFKTIVNTLTAYIKELIIPTALQ